MTRLYAGSMLTIKATVREGGTAPACQNDSRDSWEAVGIKCYRLHAVEPARRLHSGDVEPPRKPKPSAGCCQEALGVVGNPG